MNIRPPVIANTKAHETDLAKQRCVPLPSAIDAVHFHAQYLAGQAKAECHDPLGPRGFSERRNRDPLIRNQDADAGDLALPASGGSNRPTTVLAGSHCGWLR
jgi:hypothetical protein